MVAVVGGSGEGWLVAVAREPELQVVLTQELERPMPSPTLARLIEEHDLQSVVLRHGNGISCGTSVAEKIVCLAKEIYSWCETSKHVPDPRMHTSLSHPFSYRFPVFHAQVPLALGARNACFACPPIDHPRAEASRGTSVHSDDERGLSRAHIWIRLRVG